MYQLQMFEGILQSAVKHGADVLAQKVAVELPGIQLTSNDPEAKGFSLPTPEGGTFFVVIIPGVRGIVPCPGAAVAAAVDGGGRSERGRGRDRRSTPRAMPNADPMTVSPTIPDGAARSLLEPGAADIRVLEGGRQCADRRGD